MAKIASEECDCLKKDKKKKQAPQHDNYRFEPEEEEEEEEALDLTLLRSRKYRLQLTTKQKETLRKWFGAARWTYNACIDAIEGHICKMTKADLRDYLLNEESDEVRYRPWLKG